MLSVSVMNSLHKISTKFLPASKWSWELSSKKKISYFCFLVIVASCICLVLNFLKIIRVSKTLVSLNFLNKFQFLKIFLNLFKFFIFFFNFFHVLQIFWIFWKMQQKFSWVTLSAGSLYNLVLLVFKSDIKIHGNLYKTNPSFLGGKSSIFKTAEKNRPRRLPFDLLVVL